MVYCLCCSNHTEFADNSSYDNNWSSLDDDDVESTDVNNWQWINHTARCSQNSHWLTDSNW